jgi:hypothetical protein
MFRSSTKAIEADRKSADPRVQVTTLLVLLLLCSLVLAVVSLFRLTGAREDADQSERDLAVCRADLSDLARWRSVRTTGAPVNSADPELNRRLSAAAVAAGIPGELASIEPGQPNRVRETDYTETPVYLRLNAVTLRQLLTFLTDLSASDAAVRPKSIELATPAALPANPQSPGELWTTDVTLAYLTYAPRGRENK